MNKNLIYGLVFIIIVIILIIIIYLKKKSSKSIILKKHDYLYGDKVTYVGSEKMPDSKIGIQYTFSFWIRTENVSGNAHWNNDESIPKTIIFNGGSPNILYLRKDNTIQIQIAYRNKDDIIDTYNFNLKDFEAQVWVNLIVSVDNKNVIIYKNGEILTSRKIPNTAIKNYKLLSIGEKNNNFNGYVGFIDYYNYFIDSKKAKNIYESTKNKIPKTLLTYEDYEYLKKKKENSVINKIKNYSY